MHVWTAKQRFLSAVIVMNVCSDVARIFHFRSFVLNSHKPLGHFGKLPDINMTYNDDTQCNLKTYFSVPFKLIFINNKTEKGMTR